MTSKDLSEKLDEAFQRSVDSDASLSERLKTFADAGRKALPALAAAADRLIKRLQESGAGESAPRPGELMPPFFLPDETGKFVSLDQLLQDGPLAVTFHRGHWCPYCRININALVEAKQEITAEGAHVVAIMPDRQRFVAELKSETKAPFPILTDLDNGYALSLNLVIWVGAEMEKLMAERGRDLPAYQGNDSWMLPIPAIFIVGQDGYIKARFIDPDYRNRVEIEDLLKAIRSAR